MCQISPTRCTRLAAAAICLSLAALPGARAEGDGDGSLRAELQNPRLIERRAGEHPDHLVTSSLSHGDRAQKRVNTPASAYARYPR
ncbi:hypothetical protein [Methylobacterium oxalidis]|uniref:Uncharacterized protein n=1 Tax=Methylobacterium oxalidis TaxID=944322 RepID=A0A512JDK3_9HYPH|nr:hypothetical protein [Methylobacterium oxalidis]GEP07998.1 hypothetical protein MOX02_60360 [Methylobacterium oxalidis]GJE34650.1 hypothetical protein LDDCCGHA_4862 [Methylobacterium oxalidis]GLS67646.1 hypothetical protein GCM10007888_60300 [Methylobacterium oxalidis]